ncbi:hypothetical protein LSTR_LSTR016299 [Laodelphax striatellus]|uniref:Uncharacterized protein n=1 Tax=Laodelphax striatellus TaxID=195883 RepID=A0A482WZS9_LAOST|nr:hypothetical protein LSTR_LSTR016299 [Laodelphax striatellus]
MDKCSRFNNHVAVLQFDTRLESNETNSNLPAVSDRVIQRRAALFPAPHMKFRWRVGGVDMVCWVSIFVFCAAVLRVAENLPLEDDISALKYPASEVSTHTNSTFSYHQFFMHELNSILVLS